MGRLLLLPFRVIYSVYFYLLFSLILFSLYPIGKLFEIGRTERAKFLLWQGLGRMSLRTILALSGMQFTVHHRERIVRRGRVIFAANHESLLDGPLLFLLINRPNIAITAPLRSFPLVWRLWMRKLGFIEVARDLLEALEFPEAESGRAAIRHAVLILRRNIPLMIYPEGHREFRHHLLPFHSGVSRIAAEAEAPILPIALSGIDRLWPPGTLLLRPGRGLVIVGRPLRPLKKTADASTIIHQVESLERRFVRLLPGRYLSDEYLRHHHAPHGRVAAFFDFDRTIYPGYAAAAFVRPFLRRHLLRPPVAIHILRSLILESLGHLHHFRAMEQGLSGMRGWNVSVTERVIALTYQQAVKPRLIPEMRELILRHRKLGHLVFLVTEEIEPVATVIARDLHFDGFAATRLETEAGRYTGRLKGSIMYEAHKAERVRFFADRYGLDLEHSFAYADSPHDLPMLRAVGHAVCVNPKPRLLTLAKDKDWKVVHWS